MPEPRTVINLFEESDARRDTNWVAEPPITAPLDQLPEPPQNASEGTVVGFEEVFLGALEGLNRLGRAVKSRWGGKDQDA